MNLHTGRGAVVLRAAFEAGLGIEDSCVIFYFEILPADEETVFSAAHIKATHALSYADAFTVAATAHEQAVVLTGDSEFESVEELVKVEWLEKE